MGNEWIQLQPSEWNTGETATLGTKGVQVRVFLSPYDVPDAVKGSYDEDSGVFTIEFKYFLDEAAERVASHEGVITFFAGKRSKRLQKIEIKVNELGVRAVELAVHEIEEAVKDESTTAKSNYALAGEILRAQGGEILKRAQRRNA